MAGALAFDAGFETETLGLDRVGAEDEAGVSSAMRDGSGRSRSSGVVAGSGATLTSVGEARVAASSAGRPGRRDTSQPPKAPIPNAATASADARFHGPQARSGARADPATGIELGV